jgi:Concanavalin A-like lectin/glucanases superfamily
MAIQVTGVWDLQTPTTDLGSNMSQMSYSFWFSVSGAITSGTGMHLMCKGTSIGNGLFGQIFNPNDLKVSIYTSGGSISYLGMLVPGQTYLVVATHDSGAPAQNIYINGNTPVAIGTQTGNTATSTLPLHLGVDATQTIPVNVTISQPAIYAATLTAQNALDLLLGNTTPLGLSATWAPSLLGALGAPPQAGDTALANAGSLGAGSGNKYVLSSINPSGGAGSAIYVADLSYTVPCEIHPQVTNSGNLVVFLMTAPGNGTPANITAIGANPTVRVNTVTKSLYGPVWTNTTFQNPYVAYQLPAPVTSTDVVDYTIPFGAITTTLGVCNTVASPTVIPNYVGRLEPGLGGLSSFTPNPKMPLGVNLGGALFVNYWGYWLAKNLRLRWGTPFTFGSGTSAATYNSTDPTLLETWTPGGTMSAFMSNPSITNGIEVGSGQTGFPVPPGCYSFVFEDENANNGNALQVWLVGSTTTCTGTDTIASGFTGSHGATRTVVSNTVTVTYPNVAYASDPNYTSGYNLGLFVYFKSPVGYWNHNSTISNFWAFGPGDALTPPGYSGPHPNPTGNDRSDPFATASWVQNALTATNGAGPACIRAMECIGNFGGVTNYQQPADVQPGNAFTFGLQATTNIAVAAVRYYNIDPTNGTYAWSSPKLYHPLLGFTGTDSVGAYLDLNANGGASDNGQVLDTWGAGGNPDNWAVMEFRTSSAHGLRSGDQVVFPSLTTSANNVPCTGGVTSSLLGTATVTNGSAAVTFSISQTLATNQCLTFSADTTGQCYRIVTGGTGTSFLLFPTYGGMSSTTTTAAKTAGTSFNNLKGAVWVTSATTFAMLCANNFGITSGSTVQTLTGTSEVALNFNISPQQRGSVCSYGFIAHMAALWPGCAAWIPIMPYSSDTLLQAIADEMAPYLLANSTVICESGLEHWNSTFPSGPYYSVFGNLLKYCPSLANVNSYYLNLAASPPNASAVLSRDAAYTLISGHQHDVLQAQFDTHNKGIKIYRLFGSQYPSTTVTPNMVSFACGALGNSSSGGLQRHIPMSGVAIAPYMDSPGSLANTDTTWRHACATSGTSPGSWPVGAIHDWYRYWLKYSSTNWGYLSNHAREVIVYTGPPAFGQNNGKPQVVAYEAAVEFVDPADGTALEHDLFYAPGMAYTFNAMLQGLQDGSPLVANSGLSLTALYHFGGDWGGVTEQQLWSLIIYAFQGTGDGSTNQFTTTQGGSPGNGKCFDHQNVSVVMPQMQNWFAGANLVPPSVGGGASSLRRWFPQLSPIRSSG